MKVPKNKMVGWSGNGIVHKARVGRTTRVGSGVDYGMTQIK